MSRLPIRARLTLAFAAAMAVAITAIGAMLYERTGAALLEQVDNGLEAHAETVEAVVTGGGLRSAALTATDDDGFVQVIGADGRPVAASATVSERAIVTPAEIERGRNGAYFSDRTDFAATGGASARLLIGPSGDGGVVVVGASLDDREEALAGLAAQLFVVGPVALLVTSIAGYLLAGAALRPVERMRREAAAVSLADGETGRQLSLPQARDEVHRLGETLNEMIERLERSVARERGFVADASHELRTPLAALRTELDLALRRPRSSEEATAALRSVDGEVARLGRLVEDLLTLARLDDRGVASIRRERVPVRALCLRVAGRFEADAVALGRALEVRSADRVAIEGDTFRLEQAVGNLVDNALRHGEGRIDLEVRELTEAVEVAVRDEGSGFSPAFAGRAFERFTRGDDSRTGEGTGLGLAIVEAVARAHGGTARIERPVEGGSAVVLRLPR